ncbi:MAG TPA: XTP/dITP diphosphatase [bacterium]|nr:XTP/dITP diphosphatase [bacterium]
MTVSPCILLLATNNADKAAEMRDFFTGLNLVLRTAAEFPQIPAVEEDQPTLQGNAVKKASALAAATGLLSLADDTGLEVDALNGRPGVYSSRYAGENASYSENVDKLLAELQDIPAAQRSARFRCVIALANGSRVETVEGVCEGVILTARQGQGGFGYDPVFFLPEIGRTFAEMSLEEKNRISHRGRALQQARRLLEKKLRMS